MKPGFQHAPVCWNPGFMTLRHDQTGPGPAAEASSGVEDLAGTLDNRIF